MSEQSLPQKVCPVCSTPEQEHLMNLEVQPYPQEPTWRCLCGHAEKLTAGEFHVLFGEV